MFLFTIKANIPIHYQGVCSYSLSGLIFLFTIKANVPFTIKANIPIPIKVYVPIHYQG